MPRPSIKKALFISGIAALILGLPVTFRLAWLQFGPPYVAQSDTQGQVDRLTKSYISESNGCVKVLSNLPRWLVNFSPAFMLCCLFFEPNGNKYQDCFLELAKRAPARFILGSQAMDAERMDDVRGEMQKALAEVRLVTGADAISKPRGSECYQAPEAMPVDMVRKDIERALYDLNNLQVGMLAPEIEGVVQDGSRLRLSDFRKKVIFLDFWADW